MSADSKYSLNQLEQLREYTTVVADTGDFEKLKAYAPQDATTNPTLILRAVQMDRYAPLLEKAVAEASRANLHGSALTEHVADWLLVLFGMEILKLIPGRVSTEVDARLSFDTAATVAKARRIVELYASKGIERERILIKIAATWEGLQAAKVLEGEGIRCNLTLLFALVQAVEAANAKVTLISPFVGRILDWYQEKTGHTYAAHEDPGVLSVSQIYRYYKYFGYPTQVMGASFRNIGQIRELAGCDLLTISPELLEQLRQSTDPLERKLSPAPEPGNHLEKMEFSEAGFRWHMNADPMCTAKLAQGIRQFAADTDRLGEIIEREVIDS